MAFGDIDILLRARNLASPEVNRLVDDIFAAKAAVDGMSRSAGASTSAVEQLAKAFRLFGAVQGIFDLAGTAVELFNGDTQAAVDNLKRLPFGIGGAVTSIENFEKAILGVEAAEKRLAEAQSALAAQTRQLAERRKEFAKVEESIASIRQRNADALRLERAQESEGTEGFERRFIQLQIDQRKAMEDLDRLAASRTSVQQDREIAAERERISQLFGLRARALEEERAEAQTSFVAARRAEAEREEKEAKDKLEREMEIIRRAREQRLAVESDIRRESLRLQGRDADAELEAIRETFRRRVEEARRAGDEELAVRLSALERLRLAQASQSLTTENVTQRAVSALESRFLHRTPASEMPRDDLPQIRIQMERMNQQQAQTNTLLSQIQRTIPEVEVVDR